MTSTPLHLWLVGPQPPTPADLAGHTLPPVLASVDADRRLRGPYAAAGQLARLVVPGLIETAPEAAGRHDIELLAVAPDLADQLPLRRATRTALTAPRNRTRFHPGARTTRLAHGLTELVHEVVAHRSGPGTIVVTGMDEADPTDLEFVAILLRRTDPQRCRVVVHSRGTRLPDPLATALAAYASSGRTGQPGPAPLRAADPVAAYVAADGTSDDPDLLTAYEATDDQRRAQLHDRRAAELAGSPGLPLGAVLYHRERGTDPFGAGADALLAAIEHCVLEGFYHQVIELAPRCLALLDWETRTEDCWLVVAKVTIALSALSRPEEAEQWYDRACAATTNAGVHLQSAYGRAMLYTRFFSGTKRNHHKAKAWVNTAIAISQLLPDEDRRAFNLSFNENGLALVEMHLGDLAEAGRLIDLGIAHLDSRGQALADSQHHLVLAHNRAQLLAATGALEESLAAYAEVIATDPHHSEYYFERASLFRRLGRFEEAMADYSTAIEKSPPYLEPHVNRADLAAQLGDPATAVADLDYVLELDPDCALAYPRRAASRLDLGDVEGALQDAEAGLRLTPDDPQLHCLRGLAALEWGDEDLARRSLDRAVELAPDLVPARANRAVLRFEAGDLDGAIDDLTVALEQVDDPAVRENRALAYRSAGRMAEAVADARRALEHPDADRASLEGLLRECGAEQAAPA